jgi:hypothetical protein
MSMLRILLAKDLRRAWRNPLPWLIFLALPISITALVGLAFGSQGDDKGPLGRIRFAVVDEDRSLVTSFLRGAANQQEGGEYLEPVFMDREPALRELHANKLSAVFLVPTNFTRDYLSGTRSTHLELIKNPAQSIHPAVLDELLGVVVTGLNGIARNFSSEFATVQSVIHGEGDHHAVAGIIERAGDKVKAASSLLNPPLVSYTKDVRAETKDGNGASGKSGRDFNLFAYLLAGLAAMFLLFLATSGMEDLPRELHQRTFQRYHTLHHRLLPFVAGKALFTGVMLMICAAIMLGGGGLIFRIQWQQPVALLTLTLSYIAFCTGVIAALVAFIPGERGSSALTNIVAMALGLAGGCAFPPQQLPAFLREHISPWLPTYWYAEAVRNIQGGWGEVAWAATSAKLAVTAGVLLLFAVLLMQRKLGGHR